jgi:predicted esterase
VTLRRTPSNGRVSAPPSGRRDVTDRLAERQRSAARARTFRRRRFVAVVVTILVIGGIVAACSAVSGSTGTGPTDKTGGTTTSATTTTTTLPKSFEVGIHRFNWDETGPGAWHYGPTGGTIAGRPLPTEVRYPTLTGATGADTKNATPAKDGAPYPVIIFAHGFGQYPDDYSGMLDTWVRAGFVVVSPIFPDENAAAVNAVGGIDSDSPGLRWLEADEYNEPGDIAYVLKQLEDTDASPWGSNLTAVMDLSDVGLAGQSDGGNVVGALMFSSPEFRALRAELPVQPKAVALMSAQELYDAGDPNNKYVVSGTSPAVLQIQSDADGCNTPAEATDLYAALQAAGLKTKWFVTLLGADHLEPYEDANSSYASVVDAVTTTFFERELKWRSSGLTAGSVPTAGTVAGVSSVTETVNANTIPTVTLIPGC